MLKKLIQSLESSKTTKSKKKIRRTRLNEVDAVTIQAGVTSDWKLTVHNETNLFGLSVDTVNNQGLNLYGSAYLPYN